MSERAGSADTALRVADRIRRRRSTPWDVFGESIQRYEVHLNGKAVEMSRGPIHLEGYGIRDIEPREGSVGVGFSASTDLSNEGVDRTLAEAERARPFASFPAKSLELPSGDARPPEVDTIDRDLWDRPEATLAGLVQALLAPFDRSNGAAPSFGSIRATLSEETIANSNGLERKFARTSVELEFAVRSAKGPEGSPPGEYWVNRLLGRIDPKAIGSEVEVWCRKAGEVRHAKPPPSGDLDVVLPSDVLADILPAILGFRLGGAAALRGMMPIPGTVVGSPGLELYDDGLLPHAPASGPCDDEGWPQYRRHLLHQGEVTAPLYDALHAGALGQPPSASARRDPIAFASWFRFSNAPSPGPSTLVIPPGSGGSEREMAEAVGDGLWVDQLGYAFPDPISSAFGGEIRLGHRIVGGKIGEPVRGGTVGGQLLARPGEHSLLSSVVHIGSESRLNARLFGPDLAIEGLTVAGE
ncbi:MAG: TldD/PmbA family protein [Thermoplasmata archaeon]|nr:TldD/PmbA family protein [Thermoplasmata archaeon]